MIPNFEENRIEFVRFITPFNISNADFIQITLYKIFKNIVLYFISNNGI
jgi:hypothetical protein